MIYFPEIIFLRLNNKKKKNTKAYVKSTSEQVLIMIPPST